MSGSIAAIAAYDGTGTQGYGTTDKSLPGVKSVFWNENDTDKYYVNGCSFSEVSSNKGEITTPETVIFTFDNDSDAINDLTLVIERTSSKNPGPGTPLYHMLYFIERIEVCIGNQVICAMNTVQLVKDFFDTDVFPVFTNYVLGVMSTTGNGVVAQTINLSIFKMLSKNGIDSSYLMCCANNQTLQVKVYPQNFTTNEFNSYVNNAPFSYIDADYSQTANQLTVNGIDATGLNLGDNVTLTTGLSADGARDTPDYSSGIVKQITATSSNSFTVDVSPAPTTLVSSATNITVFKEGHGATGQYTQTATQITVTNLSVLMQVTLNTIGVGGKVFAQGDTGDNDLGSAIYIIAELTPNLILTTSGATVVNTPRPITIYGPAFDGTYLQTIDTLTATLALGGVNASSIFTEDDTVILIATGSYIPDYSTGLKKKITTVTSTGFTIYVGTTLVSASDQKVISISGQYNTGVALTLTSPKFTFSLYANKYSLTNAERDFLRNQVVPKRTNITQFAELTSKPSGNLNAGSQLTINCDHFNLYTSNLYILGLCHRTARFLGGFDVELYLNSTSYSGVLPYYISTVHQDIALLAHASERLFYYKIPISKNAHMKDTDQSYVPFSKFDSIRVVLTAKQDVSYNEYKDFFNTLTVVAEGKCTALYQNGAVTFNNY